MGLEGLIISSTCKRKKDSVGRVVTSRLLIAVPSTMVLNIHDRQGKVVEKQLLVPYLKKLEKASLFCVIKIKKFPQA